MLGIEEVAKKAGVSVSSVSRALRDVPGVSAATRLRVRAAADELGYGISASGSRLASGRTGTLAIVVPSAGKWFFGQVITGAGSVIRAAGQDVLLFELGDTEGRRRFFSEQRLRGRADGVIVLSLGLTEAEEHMLRKLEVPVVLLGNTAPGFGSVLIDNRSAAITAMRHLLNLGHEQIGFIGIDDHANMTAGSRVLRERAAGYGQALQDAGLPVVPELRHSAEISVEGGRLAMVQLLSAPVMPTAVFIGSDEMAFGALSVLRSSGLSVPDDLSVLGFDNQELADVMDLSTVDQGVRAQGETGARILLDAVANPGSEPERVLLPTRLVLRGTTAPPHPPRGRVSAAPSPESPRKELT